MTKDHLHPFAMAVAMTTTLLLAACGSPQKTQSNVTETKSYHFKRIDGNTTQPTQQATRTLHFSTTGTPVTDNTIEETKAVKKAATKQSGTAAAKVSSKKSTK